MTRNLTITLFFAIVCASLLCAPTAQADTFGSGANAFDINFVTIGNTGNAADTTGDPNPAGSVDYTFGMGKFEISRDMITKANAEGTLGITLFDMTPHGGNGPNQPATGVSWFEAAKFVNWLNTDSGSSPAYKFDGGGNFQLWTGADAGYDASNPFRNSLAKYFLPSSDEWYKAAYFDPTGAGSYNDHATGNSVPTAVAGGTAANTAVYGQHPSTGPAEFTLAGGLSPYGTMGQGGNVWEWEETEYDLLNDSSSSARGVRGGGWFNPSFELPSSNRINGDPTDELGTIGFRVATVPEPSSLLLGALAVGGLCCGSRRRR